MVKLLTTFSLFLAVQLTSFTTQAQSYQPFPVDSATWNVVRCWYLFNPGWYDHYSLEMDGSDTLYQGETFKKVYITTHLYHPPFDSVYPREFFGGVREANKQVFMFQKWTVDTTSHILYDFNNTDVGDTIYTSFLAGNATDMLGHVVMEVDSVLLGSTYHKRLLLQDPNNEFNQEYWTEGVGSSMGLPYASFWSVTDNSHELLCFYEWYDLLYSNPSPSYAYCSQPLPTLTCESVAGIDSDHPIIETAFGLYPNPASDVVQIKYDQSLNKPIALTIYANSGERVKEIELKENQHQIAISELKNGCYFIEIRYAEGRAFHKMVIQK